MSLTKEQRQQINLIGWNMTQSIEESYIVIYDDNWDTDTCFPAMGTDIVDIPLAIEPGDRVVLAYYNDEPTIFAPLRGRNVGDFLQSIERGLSSIFEPMEADIVHKYIKQKKDKAEQEYLMSRYRNGQMTKREIYSRAVYFEGNIVREQNGIWKFDMNCT